MPYDGAGNFTRIHNWNADKLAAIPIQSSRHDAEDDGFATAFNSVLLRNGVTPLTGNFKVGGNSITGIGAGSEVSPSISHSGDPTTGIYFPASTVIGFTIAGDERARVHNSGFSVQFPYFLGIGTNAPRTQLDMAGGIMSIRGVFEDSVILGNALTGVEQVDFALGSLVFYSVNAAANWSFNIRGDGSNTLNSIMQNNQVLTMAIEVPQGATAFHCTGITVDGAAALAVKWFGGPPTAGNANGVDVYTITIIKIASAQFQVRASMAQVTV